MLFCFQVWLLLLLQMWWGYQFWTYMQTHYYWRVSIWNSLHVILTKLYICFFFFVLKLYMRIHMFYKVFYKKSLKVNHKELIKIFLTMVWWFRCVIGGICLLLLGMCCYMLYSRHKNLE
jgi:hypothetical protein